MKKTVLIISTIFVLASCNNQEAHHHNHDHLHEHTEAEMSSETEALYEEVMRVHDDVMPKMENIQAFQAELASDSSEQASYIKEELKKADDAMMGWMREFRVPDSVEGEDAKAYFEAEKIKIENVKTLMLNSIEMAKAYQEGNAE